MDLKNTHKSKINEYKLSTDVFIAQIDNFTASTDTILKGIDKRYIQFYFCTKGSLTFNFNNGIYKINNTKASAWASVVWCNLDGSYKKTYDESTADNKVYTNDFIDITSIDLMKSSCTIDNSTLINPNIFRLNSKMEDIKQLVETYDLPTNNRSDNDVTWKGAIYAGVGQEYFSETICNIRV